MADDKPKSPKEIENANTALTKQLGILDGVIAKNIANKEALDGILDAQEKTNEKLRQQNEIYRNLREFSLLEEDDKKAMIAAEQESINLRAKNLEITQEQQRFEESLLKLKEQLVDAASDEAKAIEALIEKELALYQAREKTKKALDESRAKLKGFASTYGNLLGLGKGVSETFVGGLGAMGLEMGKFIVLTKQAEGSITEAFGEGASNALDMGLGFLIARSEEIMMAQDSMMASFRRSTGASEEFSDSVYASSESLRGMGLDMTSASEAGAALYENVTAFKDATGTTREEMGTFVGVLNELGVDAYAAAEGLQLLQQGLGMSWEQAKEAELAIIGTAKSLDMNLNQAMQDFNQHAGELIAHGGQMETVFKGLMKQARKTGLEMGVLMGIAGEYDTFEGAATAVGRLNGILGGAYLNSIEMLYATEDERLDLLRDSLAMSGRQFSDLSRYEQKAMAAAAGFQSVGEAAAFFNASVDDPAAQEAAATQKELADQARLMKPIFERLQLALNKLAISFKPLISFISSMIEGVANMGTKTKWFVGILGTLIIGFGAWFKIMKMGLVLKTFAQSLGLAGNALNVFRAASLAARAAVGAAGLLGVILLLYTLIQMGNSPSLIEVFYMLAAATAAYALVNNSSVVPSVIAATTGLWAMATAAWAAIAPFLPIVAIIGLLGLAIFGLVKYWDAVMDVFQAGFNFLKSIVESIWDLMKGWLNLVFVKPINLIISGVNMLPFVDIDKIPELAKGTRNFTGGAAIVGEEGPELAFLAKGTNVVPHDETVNAAKTALGVDESTSKGGSSGPSVADMKAAFTAALAENEQAKDKKAPKKRPPTSQPIIVKLDKREVGKVVMQIIEDKHGIRFLMGT